MGRSSGLSETPRDSHLAPLSGFCHARAREPNKEGQRAGASSSGRAKRPRSNRAAKAQRALDTTRNRGFEGWEPRDDRTRPDCARP
jgi:hypothetical protein